MTTNITNLRKAGRLDVAYKLALENLNAQPNDIWNVRNMAWVLFDYAKQNSNQQKRFQFIKCLNEIIKLDVPENEEIFYQSVGFLIKVSISSLIRAKINDSVFMNDVFDCVKRLKIKQQSVAYSSLMLIVLKTNGWWTGFGDFCEWWNFDSFMPEDFKSSETENGTKVMPLAERCLLAYCRFIFDNNLNDKIVLFLPKLENFSLKYKNYIYLPFYIAKLTLKIGQKDTFYKYMKIFAKKKSNEFWVWDLFGDAEDDKNERLKYYAKALICKSKPEMSVKVREKTAFLLKDLGYLKEALCEFKYVESIKVKNKWFVPNYLKSVLLEDWTKDIVVPNNNYDFYKNLCNDLENKVLGLQNSNKNLNNSKSDSFDFEGVIKLNCNGFGFVKFKEKLIFIPQNMAQKFKDNDFVKGKCIKSFDKKKNKDGWRAVQLKIKN
ncbi:MAG: hypothetical protein MJ211_05840 [Bacteroidales bacterium]|nr:hypothetical protein [Bacteroidales bacterium]